MVNANYWRRFRDNEVIEKCFDYLLSKVDDVLWMHEQTLLTPLVPRELKQTSPIENSELPRFFTEIRDAAYIITQDRAPECDINIYSDSSNDQSGYYDPRTKTIHLEERCLESLNKLVFVLAHEYGHHLLNNSWDLSDDYDCRFLNEGFASGIERGVTLIYTRREDDSRFEQPSLRITIESLKYVSDRVRDLGMLAAYCGDSDKIGTALFAVLEAERGPDIYRQILHGEFRW